MKLVRENQKVNAERWARYKYNLTTNIGENGERLTGSKEHIELSREIANEGMVLLENNGLLPLKENTRVALFGIGSVDYVKIGGGSGMVFSEYVRDIYEGFLCKSPKISVYEPLTKYYHDYALPLLNQHQTDKLWDIPYSEIELPKDLIESAALNSDVAIITIHRYSGECTDRLAEKGDFYLADAEKKMVEEVTKAFEHSVVVLNIGAIIDLSWIKSNPKIDAVLLAWQAGMEGGLAVADIICGDTTPSGKLPDTFASEFADYPSSDTFHESDDYVCYFEDIYVGYRYFETIPNMLSKVIYPFGYGLSYTQFGISDTSAEPFGDKIKISATVKNTGDFAGKEVVQIYYSAPNGVLGKSKISLAAFQKTKLLAPGESERLTITFDIKSMASYDDLGKLQMSAFLLEKGEYIFYIGNSSRNLKELDWRYLVAEEFIVTEQLSQKCAPNALEKRMLNDGTFEELPSFPVKDYTFVPIEPNTTKKLECDTPFTLLDVADNKITLDEFITQLTEEELILLMSGVAKRGVTDTSGIGDIERLGVPAFITADGPAGVRINPEVGIPTTAWPSATLLASTWNLELAFKFGKACGIEAKENGIAIWLAPALNIHRNPLCGRNFEYFSEDPLISGKFAAAIVSGSQSVKTACCPKHFSCNNKETNRKHSDSRVSERALREIYLKGFEICVKEANPWTIMNGYNILNSRRLCTCYEQIQGILRDEWGYDGIVMTDWATPCDQRLCVSSGNDVRMPWGEPELLRSALESGQLKREHFERCAKRVFELFLKLD